MPTQPLSLCAVTGCPTLVPYGRCSEHAKQGRREADRRRPNGYQRGYTRQWAEFSKDYLIRHPWCTVCGERATDVDHIDGSGRNGPRAYDERNLQALCHPHHSSKTARHDGGFGNVITNDDEWS